MITEMRTYILKPTTLKKFLDIYNDEIRETHVSILGNQIGFFYTEFGELNSLNDILVFFGGNGILYSWFIIMSKTYYVIWFIIFDP